MLRTDITPAILMARQAGTLPGRFGLVVTRLEEQRLDAEVAIEAVDACAERLPACGERPPSRRHRRGLRLHGAPARRREELHHDRAEEQLPRHGARINDAHRVREPSSSDGSTQVAVGDRVRAERAPELALFRCTQMILCVTRSAAARPARPRRPCRPPPARPRRSTSARWTMLQDLLDAVPPPLEPLDLARSTASSAACSSSRAPRSSARWLPFVTASTARLAARLDPAPLHALVLRRHAELEAAISARRWFDPWVFELDADRRTTIDDVSGAAVEPSTRGWPASRPPSSSSRR